MKVSQVLPTLRALHQTALEPVFLAGEAQPDQALTSLQFLLRAFDYVLHVVLGLRIELRHFIFEGAGKAGHL